MLKCKPRRIVAIAAFSVAAMATSNMLTAQSIDVNTKHSFTLDKVTVAATLTEEKLEDVANTVSIIDADGIESAMATDIRELIRYEPGVEVASEGRFGLSGFNVRGFEDNRVKILVDGVDQSRALNTGGPFLRGTRNFVDIDSLKRVDILKGPASSLYGSDALGGVVAFTTKDPADYLGESDDLAVSFKTTYSSIDNSYSETATLANRIGAFDSLLLFTRRDGEERKNFDNNYRAGQGDNRSQPDPVDYYSNNVLVKLQYHPNDVHRIGLTIEQYKVNTQTQMLSLEGPSYSVMFNYSDYTGDDTNTRERYSVSHQWSADLSVFDTLSWHLDWQSSETQQETRNFTAAFGYGNRLIDYRNQEQSLEFNTLFDKSLGDYQLTYGFKYQDTELENTTDKFYLDGGRQPSLNRYTPVIEARTFGIFSQVQMSFLDERLHITPSVRYDSYDAEPGVDSRVDSHFEDHESDKWTMRLGTVYKFSDVYSVFAQFSQGFKAPDIGQLYHEDTASFYRGYVILANPGLEPEESTNSIEAGFRANSDSGSFELSAYNNEYKNFIESHYESGTFMGMPVSIIQAQNIAEATIKGFEARGSVWLDSVMGAPTGTSLTAAIAYAEGIGNSDERPLDKPIDSIAPLKAVIGVNYDSPSNTWGGSFVFTGVERKKSKDISNEDGFSTPAYELLDITAYYQPIEPLIIRVGAYNLTDQEYWVWNDVRGLDDDVVYIDRFTQPGRNVSLSVQFSF